MFLTSASWQRATRSLTAGTIIVRGKVQVPVHVSESVFGCRNMKSTTKLATGVQGGVCIVPRD
jgi:hypothetical protein